MPASPFIGVADMHLIGKLLDEVTDAQLAALGFSERERVRADALFDDINAYLNDKLGLDWNDQEVP